MWTQSDVQIVVGVHVLFEPLTIGILSYADQTGTSGELFHALVLIRQQGLRVRPGLCDLARLVRPARNTRRVHTPRGSA